MFWNIYVIYSWGERSMGNFRDEASLPTECLEIFCLLSSLKINSNVLLLKIVNTFDL